ncbi:MAG TPA: class I SAM-dependent methyltransferase [Cyclobacteriaceae bacterium]|nr:class I SAM-dependent methyltransferase [Cyclobacteriaceae bacterium]
MNRLLDSIFETKKYTSSRGRVFDIFGETSKGQCEFLQHIVIDNQFKKSIEIGFAFGVSTLAICEAITLNEGMHVVIDKYEMTDWDGVGLDLLSQAYLSDHIEFYEEFCYKVLPRLIDKGRSFDFCYIDSTKQFDWMLTDFFFVDKLLQVGGVIVFDDVSYPGIRKLLRYISQFPHYEVYRTYPCNRGLSVKRSMLSYLRYLPKSEKFLKEEVMHSDYEMGINCSCVALRKIGEDKRNWDWHVDF